MTKFRIVLPNGYEDFLDEVTALQVRNSFYPAANICKIQSEMIEEVVYVEQDNGDLIREVRVKEIQTDLGVVS